MINLRNQSSGFTIIEVLVVIGATSMMMLTAFAFIGNQVNQTGFQTASRTFQQQLQAILNQSISGSYTYPINISCVGGTSNPTTNQVITGNPSIIAGNNTQGGNQGCIFLGKAIYIANYPTTFVNYSKITTYPIIGNQCYKYLSYSTGPPISSVCSIYAQSLTESNSQIIWNQTSLENNYNIESGLRIKYINFNHQALSNRYLCGFGIINSLNTSGAGASFGLYGFDFVGSGSPINFCKNIPDSSSSSYVNSGFVFPHTGGIKLVQNIQICMENSSNSNQTVELNIGYSGTISHSNTNNPPQAQSFNVSIVGTKCI
ncbi:MAG: prepilin-type N-terminal cleavage/methylation domain-containing protein [bacterium]